MREQIYSSFSIALQLIINDLAPFTTETGYLAGHPAYKYKKGHFEIGLTIHFFRQVYSISSFLVLLG